MMKISMKTIMINEKNMTMNLKKIKNIKLKMMIFIKKMII